MEDKEVFSFSKNEFPYVSTSSEINNKIQLFQKCIIELENILTLRAELFKEGPYFDEELHRIYQTRSFGGDYIQLKLFLNELNELKTFSNPEDIYNYDLIVSFDLANHLGVFGGQVEPLLKRFYNLLHDITKDIKKETTQNTYMFLKKYHVESEKLWNSLDLFLKMQMTNEYNFDDERLTAIWYFLSHFARAVNELSIDQSKVNKVILTLKTNIMKDYSLYIKVHFPQLIEWVNAFITLLEKNEAESHTEEEPFYYEPIESPNAKPYKNDHLHSAYDMDQQILKDVMSLSLQDDLFLPTTQVELDEQFKKDLHKAIEMSQTQSNAEHVSSFGIYSEQFQKLKNDKEEEKEYKDENKYDYKS